MEELAKTLLYQPLSYSLRDYFKPSMLFRKTLGNEKSSLEFLIQSSKEEVVFWGHQKSGAKSFQVQTIALDMYLLPQSSPERLIRILYTGFQFIHLKWVLECFLKVAKGNPFNFGIAVSLTKEIKEEDEYMKKKKKQIIWHINKQ